MAQSEVGYIFPEDAAKQVVEVGKAVTDTDNRLIKLSENTMKLIDALSKQGASLGSLLKQYDNVKKDTTEIDNLAKRLAASEKRLTELTDERTKAIIANNKAAQERNNELKREVTVVNALDGSYEQLNAQLNQNIAAYKKMSAAERENTAVGGQLLKTIQAQDAELKKIDATMGRQQRNVGNYKSHWDGLGNSIQQIGREFPSLAYGPKVFFSALSNNLPILTDQIKMAKDELKALNAQGIKGTPVWKQALSSILSWQTAMLAGITILTMYGDDLINWVSKMINAKQAVMEMYDAQKKLNEIQQSAIKNSQSERYELTLLYQATQDVNLSQKQRNDAADELQEKYPTIFSNLSNEAILAGEASEQYIKLRDSLFEKAKADAIVSQVAENNIKIIELQQKKASIATKEAAAESGGFWNTLIDKNAWREWFGTTSADVQLEIDAINEMNKKLGESFEIQDWLFDTKADKTDKTAEQRKKAEEKLAEDLIKLAEKITAESEQKEIKLHEARQVRAEERLKMEEEVAFKIRELSQKNKDAELKAAAKKDDEYQKTIDAIRKKDDERNKWLWEQRKKEESDRKRANEEIISGAGQLGSTLFDLKRAQLEREFLMAEGNAQKQAEINVKLAKTEKQKALFDIAINTASAVVKSLPNLILAGIVASIGLVQAATVAAKPIPKFATGTDYAPNEFIAGEAGREIVKTQSGDIYLAGKATHFKGNRFKGATVYTNKETEQIIKESGRGNNFVFDTKELRDEMREVKKAIIKKPVLITDNSGRVVGKESNNYREIYLNRLRNGR